MTVPETTPVASGQSLWWLIAIVAVLIAEICLLTIAVEFSQGPMAYLASPKGAIFLLMTAAMGLLLTGNDLLQVYQTGGKAGPQIRWFWLAVNLVVFGFFFLWSIWLNDGGHNQRLAGLTTWAWPLVAMLVGLSAVLSCFSARGLLNWSKTHWHRWIGAAVITIIYVSWIGDIQRTWNIASESSIEIAATCLRLLQSDEVIVSHQSPGQPALGLRNGAGLTVTRFCAEMESIAAFWVLCLALLAATWRTNHLIRLICVMFLGTILLYLLNGVRLAALILVLRWTGDSQFTVNLAHSRVSGLIFLAISVSALLVTHRWWHKRGG